MKTFSNLLQKNLHGFSQVMIVPCKKYHGLRENQVIVGATSQLSIFIQLRNCLHRKALEQHSTVLLPLVKPRITTHLAVTGDLVLGVTTTGLPSIPIEINDLVMDLGEQCNIVQRWLKTRKEVRSFTFRSM